MGADGSGSADRDVDLVRGYLGGLDAGMLVERLVALARRDEGVWLGLVSEARAGAGVLDVAGLKKQLTARLRVASRHMHWRGSSEYAREVEAAVDVLDGLLAGGHPEPVVALAEHAIKRLDSAMGRIDDSGGALAWPVERLRDVHLCACQAARPEPKKLAARLVELELGLDWEWFLDAPERYADVLGDVGLRALRARLERELEALQAAPSGGVAARDGGRRFSVTCLRESLARACGDTDELVGILSEDLSSPYRFHRVAVELEAVGREREAIGWLERGAREFGLQRDPRLRDHLIDAYLRDGQTVDAVALALEAFDGAATAGTYRLLERVATAAGVWEERRTGALERLRVRPGGYYPQTRTELVTVLLADGDLDGAWSEVRAGGCAEAVLVEFAAASHATHPDDVVPVYRALVDGYLESTRRYPEAVRALKRWRAMLALHGREGELVDDVRRLRELHRRRPSLIARLDKAGFRAVSPEATGH